MEGQEAADLRVRLAILTRSAIQFSVRPRGSGDPVLPVNEESSSGLWIPAFAGMSGVRVIASDRTHVGRRGMMPMGVKV
jgi:hypothetical protein